MLEIYFCQRESVEEFIAFSTCEIWSSNTASLDLLTDTLNE